MANFLVFLALFLTFFTNGFAQSNEYRLGTIVRPSNYELELTLRQGFGDDASFSGNVQITLSASEPTSSFAVHVDGITIRDISLYSQSDINQTNLISSRSENTTYQKLYISTTTNLLSDRAYILSVNYAGILYDDMGGFYRSWYRYANGTRRWLATTQFQQTLARRALPCFDEPNFKATFDVTIIHPSDYHAISNTPRLSEVEYNATSGLLRSTFRTTPTMSSYLLAFIVSDFQSLTNNTLNYGVYAAPHLINDAQYAFEYGPRFVSAMETFIEYPYLSSGIGKLHQVAIPDFSAGAMENWGLITYREISLLHNNEESPLNRRRLIGAVIMHELSHMWFGDLVTCDWWSYTWLNEGFARYFQYYGTAWVETNMDLERVFVIEQQQAAFSVDSSNSSSSLNSECSTPSEVSGKFSTISYNKGASVIRMVRNFLGYDNWHRALVDYINARRFSTAVPEHLFSAWQSYSSSANLPANISTLLDSWTNQGGYPLITVTLSGGNAILSQRQFLLSTSQTSSTEWYVPITYTTSHERQFTNVTPSYWLQPGRNTTISNILHGGSGWVLLNLQSSGYYRVNYDDQLWSQLLTGLRNDNFDGIPELNRAQIVDDVLNLARSRQLSYTNALNIISYLSRETSYYPWYSAFTALSYLRARYPTDSRIGTNFRNHVLDLMGTLYNSVSFNRNSSESFIDIRKKELTLQWACNLGHSGCTQRAQALFGSLRNSGIAVNPDVRSVVYCTALRHSNDSGDWYFLYNRLRSATLASEISLIIASLGCTRNSTLLSEYMGIALSSELIIRRQDVTTAFSAVYTSNPEGISAAFDFVQRNHQTITNYFNGTSSLLTILNGIISRMTTSDQLNAVERWLSSSSSNLGSISSSVRNYVSNARNSIAWAEVCSSEINEYYASYFGSASVVKLPTIVLLLAVALHYLF